MSDRRRRSVVDRDQDVTAFGGILARLCDNVGAISAALVDQEGETVDYAGVADPYEIRVAAAEWRLVLKALHASGFPGWPETREVVVRASQRSFAILWLVEGYAIVLELTPRCFAVSRRAISEAVREICSEAGLDAPSELVQREHWSRVEVQSSRSDRRKPAAVWVGSSWQELALLGRYEASHLARGEVGFRARLPNGAEINLVRERLGRWYAEDLPSH